ncbi:MAG: hypothetical protein R3F30_07060 [Planctomycetota bacterium]
MRRRLLTLIPALCLLGSCQYLKDRSADFLDQYRLSIGAGSVLGVKSKALGLVDTGLMMGVKPHAAALGWRYGQAMFFHEADMRIDADQAEIIKTTGLVDMDYAKASYWSGWNSAAILPALLSWVDASPVDYAWQVPEDGDEYADRHWIWSPEAMATNRYAQVHVFDVETQVGLVVYLDVGYSPGELIDFLAGLVTLDLAGDDGRW